MKKYFFQLTLVGMFLMFLGILSFVTFVAYRRDSGYAGVDMMKVQKIRQEASKI